jgi:TPR repeat protein
MRINRLALKSYLLQLAFGLGIATCLWLSQYTLAQVLAVGIAGLFLAVAAKTKTCSHGIWGGYQIGDGSEGVRRRDGLCSMCMEDGATFEAAYSEANQKHYEKKETRRANFGNAKQLVLDEAVRLRSSLVPSLTQLRNISPQQFENYVASIFEKDGYKVKQTPYTNDGGRDAIMIKHGEKYLLECKRYGAENNSGRPDIQKFHSAIVSDKAKGGFFVTTSGFTKEAVAYADLTGIKLVDGYGLQKWLYEVLPKHADDSYTTMCPECFEKVFHHLSSSHEAVCSNGHSVAPSLTIDDVFGISTEIPPNCSKCGQPMRLVRSRRGNIFWGCSQYPTCQSIREYKGSQFNPNADSGSYSDNYNNENLFEDCYEIHQDFNESVKLFQKAAEQGDATAQCEIGSLYENGQVLAQNYKEAEKWYRKAAKQGNETAQFKLGNMYKYGQGVTQDNVEAEKWYRKAAEQGGADAQFSLGLMYKHGQGIDQDDKEADKWYRKAAEQGHPKGQFYVGYINEKGLGVEQNNKEAEKWYLKSAEQGEVFAQKRLGNLYLSGLGIVQDYKEAEKWFRKAAEQGDADSQYRLAYIYEKSLGVDQNNIEAKKWYSKAADQGNAEAQIKLKDLRN